jgi:hypothetical protein
MRVPRVVSFALNESQAAVRERIHPRDLRLFGSPENSSIEPDCLFLDFN